MAGGAATVSTCFDLYKFAKELKGHWTQSQERARTVICAEMGDMLATDITPDVCEAYAEKRFDLDLARDTVRIELAYLRAAVKHAADRKRIPHAPTVWVPSGGEARERWCTNDEINQLIDGAQELHVKLYIILAVTTAARPSHILQLTWDRVDLEHRVINFRDPSRGPNNKRRPRVPINDTAYEHLQLARELRRTEYVIEWQGKPIAKIRKGVTEAARRAGLEGVTPYVLRHTAGVWMANAGVPMAEIAAYMGHSSMETTRKHYAHFHPEFMGRAASALVIRRND